MALTAALIVALQGVPPAVAVVLLAGVKRALDHDAAFRGAGPHAGGRA